MSYYDTIEEDLARAKQILVDGAPSAEELRVTHGLGPKHAAQLASRSGTIYGKDTYAAYKLLESFVAEIERLRAELACPALTLTGPCTCPDARHVVS
jgi:hypothetical protein